MGFHLQGGSELDGGPLSALSESYFMTHPRGMYAALHFKGELDIPVLEEAVRHVQRGFPSLTGPLTEARRGLFHYLSRSRGSPPPLEVHAFDQRIGDRKGALVRRILGGRQGGPFDLFREAPARFSLFRFPENRSTLVVNVHHTCADGHALLGMIASLLESYRGREARLRSDLVENASEKRKEAEIPYWPNVRDLLKETYVRRRHRLIKRRPLSRDRPMSPAYEALTFGVEETRSVLNRAKAMGIGINDFLNISVIQSIDEVRGWPDGVVSVCYPVNLRRYLPQGGRHGNLTSGFYIHLDRRQRATPEAVLRNFVEQRRKGLDRGRALFNLVLLQKTHRFLRLWPQKGRIGWLRRLGGYPATFFCSNLGKIRFESKSAGLEIEDYELLVSPNRHADYSLIAATFNDSLKISISADESVVGPGEPRRFRERLKARLLGLGSLR